MIHISDVSRQENALNELRPLITAHAYRANSNDEFFSCLWYLSELVARRDILRYELLQIVYYFMN